MMNKSYINYLKSAKKSDNTIKNYTKYVEAMLNFVGKPDTEVTFLDLTDYQASISHLASNSVRLQISAIKNYFSFLHKAGVITANPAEALEKPKANPKVKPYINADIVRAMLNHTTNLRDRAIVNFMCSTGVRVTEMTEIELSDYYEARETQELTILGKGNKERVIYINDSVMSDIEAYLATRNDECSKLFVSHWGGPIYSCNLSRNLKTIARRAGVEFSESISNHTMRAAFATIASERGAAVADISKAMGHSSIAITSVYIKNSQQNINNVMANMTF